MTFKEQLNALSAVKFPLMLAIVCIHVQNMPIPATFDWYYVKFWGEVVGRIGVPLFFFISGVMYFCNVESDKSVTSFVRDIWRAKAKKRLKTLLAPYLIWNVIAFVFYCLKGSIEFTFEDFFNAQWACHRDKYWFFPADGVMWFIRDLFIVSLLATPVLYLVSIKINDKVRTALICLLIFTFALLNTQIPAGSLVEALLLFSLGGIIGIGKMEFIEFVKKTKWITRSMFLVFSLIYLLFFDKDYSYILCNVTIIVGALTFIGLTYKSPLVFGSVSLASLSMFIFASHAILKHFSFFFINKLQLNIVWIEYTLRVVLTVLICTLCYYFAKKFFPRILSISIGGR